MQVKLCEKLDKDSAKKVKVYSFPNAASTTYDPIESLSTDVSETWTAAGSWVFSSLAIASECLSVAFSLKCQNKCCPVDWFRSNRAKSSWIRLPVAVHVQRCLCLSSQYKEREDEMSRCQHVTATRAIAHYYFPVFLFSSVLRDIRVSLVRTKKKLQQRTHTHTHTQKINKTKHFWRSLRSRIRTLSQAKSKLRAQKSMKTANRCNCRIRKSVKIVLWIRNPGENTVRIRWYVSLFTPLNMSTWHSRRHMCPFCDKCRIGDICPTGKGYYISYTIRASSAWKGYCFQSGGI